MEEMKGQSSLLDFGLISLPEENVKAIKKLAKLTGKPQSEYNNMELEEINKLIAKEEEEAKKKKDLVKKLGQLNLEYDESKTLQENAEILEAAEYRAKNPVYVYPFRIYFKGCDIQEPDHIFEQGKQYTDKDISKMLFKAGYKEFAGNVSLTYEEEENMIIPNFTSQRHG